MILLSVLSDIVELLPTLSNIILVGLILSFVVMGIYIHSKILHIDDFSVEGSFSLGGALTAYILTQEGNGWITLPLSLIIGMGVGAISGFLQTKLRINSLISGIITTTGLFSVHLWLSGANVPLMTTLRIFSRQGSLIDLGDEMQPLLYLILLFLGVAGSLKILQWFLKTEIGFLLRANGTNPQIIKSLGKNPNFYTVLGLMLGNGLCALGGCLFVQYMGFFSIWGSVGILISGIAGLILAELINPRLGISLAIGAIVYQAIMSLTLEINHDPTWNKAITALLVVLLLQMKHVKRNKEAAC